MSLFQVYCWDMKAFYRAWVAGYPGGYCLFAGCQIPTAKVQPLLFGALQHFFTTVLSAPLFCLFAPPPYFLVSQTTVTHNQTFSINDLQKQFFYEMNAMYFSN